MDPNQNRSVPILTTKLNMPLQKPNLVVRQALIDRLSEGLRHNNSLFLVSAPAGYGKTTLVCEWLNSESFCHTWLSVDEKDNDPVRFLTYLLAAIQKIFPEAGQVTRNLFALPLLPPVDVLITPLINDLTELKERVIVAIDDYHLINNRYIHDVIQFILNNRPHLLHLVLISREDPPLAFPRLWAGGLITEILAGDLRFSEAETAAFMSGIMKLNLESEAITILNMITEGWIAGLQLVALSLQGHTPEKVESFIINFSASNRYILDYLVSEVLDNLTAEVRDFLQQTSVLDRLCASLCNAVTGRGDSRQLLELLKHNNLFLFPLDEERQWYRYHHLFADLLRKELSLEEQQAVHQKAARWYEANGYLEEAVDQTIAAADYQEAGRLIYPATPEIFFAGRLTILINWLNALPEDSICSNGELAICKMYVLNCLGQIEGVEPYLKAFENDPKAQASMLNRGRFYIIRSTLANSRGDPRDLQLAEEALELVKDSDNDYIGALNTYGLALRSAGKLTEAIRIFQEAFGLRRKIGYNLIIMYAAYQLLFSLELNGKLGAAIKLGENIIAEMLDPHGLLAPLAKVTYLPLGNVYYQTNALEQALKYFTEGSDICRKLSINRLVTGESTLALLYDALGYWQQALLTIHKSIRETDPSLQPLASFDNAALEAELMLRKGKLQTGLNWAEHWRLSPADKPGLLKEQSYFTFVRLLLAQQRFQEALNLLDYLEGSTRAGQRYGRLITVHILQALAYNLCDEEPKSLQYLLQALKMAAPEGYYRPFLDGGPSIEAMLLKIQAVEPEFTLKLLTVFAKNVLTPDNSAMPITNGLIEPLSPRELELLKLVAAGLSNQEIARKLLISLSTTKSHLYSIFQKLEVDSRTRAIVKAKELNLV